MRISILSSHAALRECLRTSLSKLERFEVDQHDCAVACCRSLSGIAEESLLLADVSYPVPGLLDLLRACGPQQSSTRVILVGMDASEESKDLHFLEEDIDGSLPIDATLTEMVDAIDRVLMGEKIYPPSIAFVLYQRLAKRSREQSFRQRLGALTLSRRELEVLQLLAERFTNDAIASRLGISIHTVKNHVHNILDKLQVENRASAADVAFERGWLKGSPVKHAG